MDLLRPVEEIQAEIKAEMKAWDFFKKLLGDDEKFFALVAKGEPIEIVGSIGGRYFLYPDGQLARIGSSKPELGRVVVSSNMPLADHLSALLLEVTKREPELIKNWRCGNLSFNYQNAPTHDRVGIWEGRIDDTRIEFQRQYYGQFIDEADHADMMTTAMVGPNRRTVAFPNLTQEQVNEIRSLVQNEKAHPLEVEFYRALLTRIELARERAHAIIFSSPGDPANNFGT